MKQFLKELHTTDIRWNREKFWIGTIVTTIVPFILIGILSSIIFALSAPGLESQTSTADVIGNIFRLIIPILLILSFIYFFVVKVFIYIKRLRDLDQPGMFALLLIVPFANLGLLIYCGFFEGTKGDNRYGPDPLAKEREIEKS